MSRNTQSCVNFPAYIQLASDWFKNNQVLSDSHMHNTVNLSPEVAHGRGRGRGGLVVGW